MSKEMKLEPELRFPEFVKDGEWDEKTLGDVSESESSNLALNKIELKEEGFPVYGADSVVGYINEFQQEKEYISIVKDGSGVGRLNLCEAKSSILGTLACIKSKDSNYFNLDWIYYLMNTIDFTPYKKGSGIPHIYFSDFKGEKIGIPKPQEQQKIASCLSSLDELLAAHNDKLQALKDHKKGLMQNLFPQEGEKVPKNRFQEFEKDGEWVETKLGEAAEFINGRAYKKEELLSKGKYRVLRVGNFFTNKEWYYSDLELDKDKYCENGDLLYAWSASFGPFLWKEEKVIFHYHIWKVKNKSGIDRLFLYNLLDYETFRMKSESLNGFALMHLTKGAIENWDSLTPSNLKEQQKIATCLSAVDEVITAQSEKIEQLKLHKVGLMQGLFPKK